MSKSFKSEIKKRYEGRGNTWVKVPKDHVVYNDIINLISKFFKTPLPLWRVLDLMRSLKIVICVSLRLWCLKTILTPL